MNQEQAKNILKNLTDFNAQSKMQKATYAFIASQLVTKEEIEKVAQLFRGIDRDNNGKVDK